MKVTVIKDEPQKNNIISSIFLLILGIILTFNSKSLIVFIFNICGLLIFLYGIYKMYHYYALKKKSNIIHGELLKIAITSMIVGILVIILSNFLTNAIQVVTGIWLIFIGLEKLQNATIYKGFSEKKYLSEIISSIIIILLAFYTIFTDNVLFIFLGIVLIIYAVSELISLLLQKKN